MERSTPQGRGSSFIQMFGKTSLFAIFLTKTFLCHQRDLPQPVPSSVQATCWGQGSVPAQTQQGEPREEGPGCSRVPTSGAPGGVWDSPGAVRGFRTSRQIGDRHTKHRTCSTFSAAVTPDQLKRILKVR